MRDYIRQLVDALERGRRFVTHDIWHIGRPGEEIPHGFIIKQVRVAILLVQSLIKDALTLRAAALTFATILSIVPFLALMFFIIQTFNLGENVSDALTDRVRSLSVKVGVMEPAPDTPDVPAAPGEVGARPGAEPEADESHDDTAKNRAMIERVLKAAMEGLPKMEGSEHQDPLPMLMSWIEKSSNPGAIGTIAGIVFVLTTVFGLMNNIESSFNSIWGLDRTRSWYRMLSDYMMIVLVLPFLVAAVVGITVALEPESVELGPFSVGLSGVRYGVFWVAFGLMYLIVPNTKVQARYAAVAGIVAGTLWILSAKAYAGLQVGLAKSDFFFGGFALFPLLLMWIYVSWLIVLFGAELTFAYQHEKTFAMERLANKASYAYREAVGLRAMVEIAHRFDSGLPALSPAERAAEWNVPVRLLNDALDVLENVGLIMRCATDPVTYQPARSIDKIRVGEVVTALREAGQDPSAFREDDRFRPVLDELRGTDTPPMTSTVGELARGMGEQSTDSTRAQSERSEETPADTTDG